MARFSGEPEARSPLANASETGLDHSLETQRNHSLAAVAAQAHYFARYEEMAKTAQLYAGTELCHTVSATAMLFLIAADAEENDPVPSAVRDCACVSCRLYRLVADKSEPDMERLS